MSISMQDVDDSVSTHIPAQVTIYVERKTHEAIVVPLEGKATFLDIREHLVELGVDMTNKVLVDERDNVKEWDVPLGGNVPASGLAAKNQVKMQVIHDGQLWEANILLNSKHTTIQTIKNQLMLQDTTGTAFNGVTFTWQGIRVTDDFRTDVLPELTRLLEPDIENENGQYPRNLVLVGRKQLVVMDIDVGEISSVGLKVTDEMLVSDVLELYKSSERRHHLNGVLVSIYKEGETTGESMEMQPNLNQSLNLYASGIDNDTTLAIKTQMFEVIFKEKSEIDKAYAQNRAVGAASLAKKGQADYEAKRASDSVEGIAVQVFDYWRVKRLRDAYSALVTEGISENDELRVENFDRGSSSSAPLADKLQDEKPLYFYNLKPGSVIIVEREDFTVTYCMYICADCGSDVRLKPRDAVRCRECGHRIVFKRRIAKPAQYICR